MGNDRMLITAAFNRGTKDDKTWITLQIRKEFYGSNNVIYTADEL